MQRVDFWRNLLWCIYAFCGDFESRIGNFFFFFFYTLTVGYNRFSVLHIYINDIRYHFNASEFIISYNIRIAFTWNICIHKKGKTYILCTKMMLWILFIYRKHMQLALLFIAVAATIIFNIWKVMTTIIMNNGTEQTRDQKKKNKKSRSIRMKNLSNRFDWMTQLKFIYWTSIQ